MNLEKSKNGKKVFIHVNQHNIKANRKNGTSIPVLTVKSYNSNDYAHEAVISKDGIELGRIIYSQGSPLSCGAEVWIQFNDALVDIDLIGGDK